MSVWAAGLDFGQSDVVDHNTRRVIGHPVWGDALVTSDLVAGYSTGGGVGLRLSLSR